LKLADFGQAELNSLLSRTKPRSVANTLTYRPPECDLQDKTIRQSYDIWCLGCVLLEFVAWMLGGKDLMEKFSFKRLAPDVFQFNKKTDTFFQVVTNALTLATEVMVKKSVTDVGKMSELYMALLRRLLVH
jgi:serine/threonine protein kinase